MQIRRHSKAILPAISAHSNHHSALSEFVLSPLIGWLLGISTQLHTVYQPMSHAILICLMCDVRSHKAPHPVLGGDWQRRFHRREVVKLLRHQRVDVERAETASPALPPPARLLSRAERAHYRLSWKQRLARNARRLAAPDVSIKLFGIPEPLPLLSVSILPENGSTSASVKQQAPVLVFSHPFFTH